MSALSELNKQNGVVYTPSSLANYVAQKLMEYFFQCLTPPADSGRESLIPNLSSLANVRIIDPACGHGELLLASWDAFYHWLTSTTYKNLGKDSLPNPRKVLCGIDIDQEAIRKTRRKIESIPQPNLGTCGFNLLRMNALYPFNKASSEKGWEIVRNVCSQRK